MSISQDLNEVVEYLNKLSNDTDDHLRSTGDILLALSEFTNVGLEDLKSNLGDILKSVEELEKQAEDLEERIEELEKDDEQ